MACGICGLAINSQGDPQSKAIMVSNCGQRLHTLCIYKIYKESQSHWADISYSYLGGSESFASNNLQLNFSSPDETVDFRVDAIKQKIILDPEGKSDETQQNWDSYVALAFYANNKDKSLFHELVLEGEFEAALQEVQKADIDLLKQMSAKLTNAFVQKRYAEIYDIIIKDLDSSSIDYFFDLIFINQLAYKNPGNFGICRLQENMQMLLQQE